MGTGGETVVGCGRGVAGDDGLLGPLLAPAPQEIADLADEFASVRAARDEAEPVGVLAGRAGGHTDEGAAVVQARPGPGPARPRARAAEPMDSRPKLRPLFMVASQRSRDTRRWQVNLWCDTWLAFSPPFGPGSPVCVGPPQNGRA